MTKISRIVFIAATLLGASGSAFSQPPEPPLPPEPPSPALAPVAPLAPIAPMAPVAPMAPMAPLASIGSILRGIDFAQLGYLALQDVDRDTARRARDVARQQQDRDERYYREGKSYLDRKEYDRAIAALNRVIETKGSRADGALYWRAYAQNKMGHRDEALASLTELQTNYASSHWLDDAKALQVEVRQQNGQPVQPEAATDEDLKLLALNSLMNTDPERSVPMLETLLKGTASPKVKERALFVLAQSRSPKAREVLASVAKGGSNPDLQSKAVEYLGIYGGHDNLQVLVDVYKGTNDLHLKRTILNSFMVAGSKDNLLAVAKSESNNELKMHAISLLGNVGGSADLAQLYSSESSPEVKRTIIQGLFVSGNSDKLFELAKTEKDAGLRHYAINQLGVMGKSKTGPSLAALYPQETDADNKKAIINALFIQGNATAMVEIARKETDMNMKKLIVNQLSIMHSKEATDYLMELLAK
jgi:tetratricopeptide (TPR) repeat protein